MNPATANQLLLQIHSQHLQQMHQQQLEMQYHQEAQEALKYVEDGCVVADGGSPAQHQHQPGAPDVAGAAPGGEPQPPGGSPSDDAAATMPQGHTAQDVSMNMLLAPLLGLGPLLGLAPLQQVFGGAPQPGELSEVADSDAASMPK